MSEFQITPETIESALSDENAFKVISESLSKKGYSLMDEKARNELITNFKSSADFKSEIENVTKTYHSNYENDLKEVFGHDSDLIKPKEGESKVFHINKRILKDQAAKIKELEEKISKGGDHKDFYESKLKEAEEKYRGQLEKQKEEFNKLQSSFEATQKTTKFIEEYSPIKAKIDPSRIDEIFLEAEKFNQEFILKNSRIENGELVMLTPDGEVQKDAMFKPITAKAFLEKKFEKLFKKEDAGGGGTDPKGQVITDPSKVTVENFILGEAKTKAELIDKIHSAGIESGTAKFAELFHHFGKTMK